MMFPIDKVKWHKAFRISTFLRGLGVRVQQSFSIVVLYTQCGSGSWRSSSSCSHGGGNGSGIVMFMYLRPHLNTRVHDLHDKWRLQ